MTRTQLVACLGSCGGAGTAGGNLASGGFLKALRVGEPAPRSGRYHINTSYDLTHPPLLPHAFTLYTAAFRWRRVLAFRLECCKVEGPGGVARAAKDSGQEEEW